jgi:predicted PurR-regulated permease PerM
MNNRLQGLAYGSMLAIAIGWVLWIGQAVFLPIAFSILVVYVILGTNRLVSRLPGIGRRMPLGAQYTLSLLVISAALAATFWLIAANLSRAIELVPLYQESLLATIQDVSSRLGIEAQPTWASVRQYLLAQASPQKLLGYSAGLITSLAGILVVSALYVVFLLIDLGTLPRKLTNMSDDPAAVAQLQKIVTHVNARIGTYLALKTFMCVITGLVSWAIMAWVGLELAAFFGVLIALVNYIPYLGSFLGVSIPVSFGLLQFGLSPSLLLLLVLLGIAQFFLGNVVDPYLMANSLNLSPFAILASLAAWSALWGLAGAFLAVPLTASLAMVLAEFKGTRPVAVLLSKTGRVDED